MTEVSVRIFTGPTLGHAAASELLDADLRPPITVDDLPRAMADDVDIVCIIDGAFVQRYSASPTQILECLRSGIIVFGAASAGALRAVETEPYGTHGVGEIFRLFKRGFLAEDELLMTYDPETLRPLAVAMINVRYAVQQAERLGVIERREGDVITRAAKDQYFAHRTYRSIGAEVTRTEGGSLAPRFLDFVAERGESLDLKRRDAVTCLRVIAAFVNARQSTEAESA